MHSTRSSARLQLERTTEHNNQLLSLFNDMLKVTCKLSLINEQIIVSSKNNKKDALGINTVDIKEKDLDEVLSSKEKKAFIDVMNNIYTNLQDIFNTTREEQIKKEEEMKRKKIEEKFNKKIESLKKEIMALKQANDISNKSLETSQFKKELVQLSLSYKDEYNIDDGMDMFNNIQYHKSFIDELYVNSKEKLKQELGNNRRTITTICESIDKEMDLIRNVMNHFMIHIDMYEKKLDNLETIVKNNLSRIDNNNDDNKNNNTVNSSLNLKIENNNISSVTIFKMFDQLDHIQDYINKNKENIDSIPIIQKYTYKNEQDIKDTKLKLEEISYKPIPPPINTTATYNNNNNNMNDNPDNNSNRNNNMYMNKRQKTNDNDYYNRNNFDTSPDDLVPISNDQRTLNASNMFNRNRRNKYNNTSSATSPITTGHLNSNFNNNDFINRHEIDQKFKELEDKFNYQIQSLNKQFFNNDQKHIDTIVQKFTEINTDINRMQLENSKNLSIDVGNQLKNFQDNINSHNLNYIDERIKHYNKTTLDTVETILKNMTQQVNYWKKKVTKNLEHQFGYAIQELKLQILSLAKLPLPTNSVEYKNLLEFLKDVFRWNWEQWKIEWTKEFYQCVKCLQNDYILPLETKVKKLENENMNKK
ncbi:hypothetical protein BCR32DRAFT_264084 [Anaeromyces robustus]|uniref:Uncharacterized protein n=1 Tax=Anaeromyces robustus TaxID=1754192 RepID=A0A1Y1XPK3_9FUNG|nr:hypothetical protein BCR32DRAFT_264084 [Anaeromyces robustus]|eukprot:ORX87662.1 hypothetical protein BCR32DRAFT_264084 [Anaeromyces robustus]